MRIGIKQTDMHELNAEQTEFLAERLHWMDVIKWDDGEVYTLYYATCQRWSTEAADLIESMASQGIKFRRLSFGD